LNFVLQRFPITIGGASDTTFKKQRQEEMPTERQNILPFLHQAIVAGGPVVGLESTVIAHGLPHPLNLETALSCEQAVTQAGALAATIGIVDGVPTIGLSEEEMQGFARGKAPDGSAIDKVGLNNLAGVLMRRRWGATTVAAGGDDAPRPEGGHTGFCDRRHRWRAPGGG
jgi:pseudouridine-5'-phosphate glycosidase